MKTIFEIVFLGKKTNFEGISKDRLKEKFKDNPPRPKDREGGERGGGVYMVICQVSLPARSQKLF